MALLIPSFPPSGHYVEYIRESSRALTQAEAVTVSVRTGAMVSDFCRYVPLSITEYHRIGTRFCARVMHAAVSVTKLTIESFDGIPPILSSFQNGWIFALRDESGSFSNYILLGSIWASG